MTYSIDPIPSIFPNFFMLRHPLKESTFFLGGGVVLCRLSVMACGLSPVVVCGRICPGACGILYLQPGIEPIFLALEAQSLNH